jgi:hypothetical protein
MMIRVPEAEQIAEGSQSVGEEGVSLIHTVFAAMHQGKLRTLAMAWAVGS